eukprot:NODE_33_length_36935_cov_1.609241.p19 type:complete len:279 gc:universal NODE_33_length_36935_cov_1.609241:29830-30666(+)
MDPIASFSFSILGINSILFAIGVTNALFTFKRKTSLPCIIVLAGLVSMYVSTMLSFSAAYFDPSRSPSYVLADTFFYTQMVQWTLWSYYFRIKTIPKYGFFDKYIFCIPFIIAIFQIPEAIYYNLDSRFENYDYSMQITATLSGLAIITSEFFMYFVLIKKLFAFIEQRSEVWILKLSLTMTILLLLDLTEIVLYFVDVEISTIFYSLSFNVRLNAVVLFYGNLVSYVKKGSGWRSHVNTPLNSNNEASSEIESAASVSTTNYSMLKFHSKSNLNGDQ